MDYSTSYFGIALSDLTYNDIVDYFNQPRLENETIEYKSFPVRATFDAGLQNVNRGISAFLNSSGGILVWGAPKGIKQEGYSEDVFVGELCPVNELCEKDRLINKIGSAITPLPIGVSVQILSKDNQYIYIFEVQQSIYKPHQYDGRYFIRLDGQTKPAPHYLVDALIKQISYPNLNAIIKFHKIKLNKGDSTLIIPITVGVFNFSQLQNEESVSFRLLCIGGYFPNGQIAQPATHKPRYNIKSHQLIFDDFAAVLHFGNPNIHDDVIYAKQQELEKNNGYLDLMLTFGGKKSPAKISTYKLNLNNVSLSEPPYDFIEVSDENRLFADLKQKSNSIEQSLEHFKKFKINKD